ncbi:PLC-like phosphodiesterase [Pholiota conissans]|uniref:PLC-like phosphodiesterase n=1 Tax=Pholiota conissans TaxID=109636 RepID=A0A9P6D339_9AGAR|nr:PLC-like phosphodiesterase [Pholiota conissans]
MKVLSLANYIYGLVSILAVLAGPGQTRFQKLTVFDVQGHRGSRGENSESVLPAFAWALIDGVTTLELDNGITKDGAVVVWHDEVIMGEKCNDTMPAFNNDPDFPYVGKHVANLTLAQIKTLDCGSKRQANFPLQVTHAGTKISTLPELFQFAQCADPDRVIRWNIESKINPVHPNYTRGVDDFVSLQHSVFVKSGYSLSQITYQSFDWRTLIEMKALEPQILTSALIDNDTGFGENNNTSPWLAGLRVQDFPGATRGEQVAYAVNSIRANIISPNVLESGVDPVDADWVPFTTKEMVDKAHELGVMVKPFTVNRLNSAAQLLSWGVDGIITDYPTQIRRLIRGSGELVAQPFPKKRVLKCLQKHLQKV